MSVIEYLRAWFIEQVKKGFTEMENMREERMSLCPPWDEYYNKLKCMFDQDPDIKLNMDRDKHEYQMFVTSWRKAEALEKVLPNELQFGNDTWYLTVVPANAEENNYAEVLKTALEGNPVFERVIGQTNPVVPFIYFSFAPVVAQYYNDSLAEPSGLRSILYADLAKELFKILPDCEKEIRFCTGPLD